MLSNTAEYALRAILYLAECGGNDLVRVEAVASALSVPRNYLSKVLHSLAQADVLISLRGPRGGFRLARAPGELTLEEVVSLFDPPGKRRCPLGRPQCSDRHPCPAHPRWKAATEPVRTFFRETTVADLMRVPASRGRRERPRPAGRAARGRAAARSGGPFRSQPAAPAGASPKGGEDD